MKYLLILLFGVALFTDVFRMGLSLGPGLSVQNAVLYMLAMAFMLRLVVRGGFQLTLPRMHAAFALLIGYAILSVLIIALVVKLPGYRLIPGVIALKSNLIDQFLFFAICYYGAATTTEALLVLRALLVIVVTSSVITVVNATGLMTIGALEVGASGRVQGALGEANQYAAFLATMVPPLMAACATSRRPAARLFWLAGLLLSLISIVMTVSRGGILALVLSCAWGTFYFRRYLPVGRIMAATALSLAAVLAFAAMSGTYIDMLHERVIGQTFVNTGGDMTSGRSEIWETAFTRMMEAPWSLLSGFGWFAYESMGFRFLTHNTYLLFWFNLGLVGVLSFVFLLTHVFRTATHAVAIASPDTRLHLMGLTVGVVALAVAIFFVNLFSPWSFIWALIGLGMRLAVNELAAHRANAAATRVGAQSSTGPRFGWSAAEKLPAR